MIDDYFNYWLNNENYGFDFIFRELDIEQIIFEGNFFLKNNPIKCKNYWEKNKLNKKYSQMLSIKLKNINKKLKEESNKKLKFI